MRVQLIGGGFELFCTMGFCHLFFPQMVVDNASKNKVGTGGTGQDTAKLDRESEELKRKQTFTRFD